MSDRAYPTRPFVGIGIVVIKGDQVLLCQRGKPPNLGSWTLPGGAQAAAETSVAATGSPATQRAAKSRIV